MIILSFILAGAIIGAYTAKKRGGAAADIAQYAAGFAIALGILGFIATIVIHRLAV